jgi:serine/threonine-protein kinase
MNDRDDGQAMAGEVRDAPEDTRVGLIGKTLGRRYRITAELGRGGMATVYRAVDPQLARDVAVKVMHGTFAGRQEIEARFRREAQAVAAIKHEGIVSVFDFAPPASGEPAYIVTEIVEGPTLRALMDRHGGRLLPEIAALMAGRVAAALGAAHARGIVHRDVKPDNVMVDLRPGGARVLLTDFGVAHIADGDTMTATGAVIGSPMYMSPEQARGAEVGPPSDVFSLGVLLYHVATGRAPFSGQSPAVAIAAILNGEFLRPSQVDAHVGRDLEAVILRCMKKLPGERYPDAGAVAVALAEVARGAGLGDGGESLRRFFDDGERFVAELRPRIAEQAHQRAREAARRRDLVRALAEINRAFAYQPDHAGAKALLAAIAARRRAMKVVAAGLLAVVVLAGAGAGGIVAKRRLSARDRDGARGAAAVAVAEAVPRTAAATGGTPRPPATPPTPAPASTALQPSATEAEAATSRSTAKPHPTGSPGRARRPAAPAVAMHAAAIAPAATLSTAAAKASGAAPASPPAPPASLPAPQPKIEAATAPATATTAAPAAVAGVAADTSAGLVLRASQGFCSPSMDDQPPSLRASYSHVRPGPHDIYCTLPLPAPGGTKVLVGRYDLRPGAHASLVIIPGPNGPVLSRPD